MSEGVSAVLEYSEILEPSENESISVVVEAPSKIPTNITLTIEPQ